MAILEPFFQKQYSLKCFESHQTGGLDLMLFTLRSTSVAAARSWTSCWWQILQVVSDKSENKTTANLHNPLCHLEFDFLFSKKQSGSRSRRKTNFATTSKQYFIALLWYILLSHVFANSLYLSVLNCSWLCLNVSNVWDCTRNWIPKMEPKYWLCSNTWYRRSYIHLDLYLCLYSQMYFTRHWGKEDKDCRKVCWESWVWIIGEHFPPPPSSLDHLV